MEERANDWYNNYAEVQIKNMQSGNFAVARSVRTITTGKTLFDRFRSAITQLQQVSNHDLTAIQVRVGTISRLIFICAIVLWMLAIVILWSTFTRFVNALREQLNALKDTTGLLGTGNLSARVPNLAYDELNEVGQTFNSVTEVLEEQQNALKERDVLEGVLQLNTILSGSLDLKTLADEFIGKVLTLLDLHIGAIYLYDSSRKQFTLFTAQGFDHREIQAEFQAGEGTVGRVALSREPLYLTRPVGDGGESFKIKTMLGVVLPASTYYLPLIRGSQLIGALGVGSALIMSEKARNVLNVVTSNLAAAISNTQAYQHIQSQAEELKTRSREQERMNNELRRQRDELTILNSALEAANRARSQFLSTMSHELRTPLTSIIGFSKILLNSSGNGNFNQRQKNDLERILKNGKHLLVLINDVLDLTKIESGRMDVNWSQVNLRELISSVVEETQSIAIEQKLTLRANVEEGTASLETDSTKLRQILLNLISNALKFTEQGEVTVTATRVTSSDNEAEQIAIAVKDTGIGIAPEVQERIFEAFYQADSGSTRKFGGTGLGLSIVRELTTLLGGKLEVQSSPGQSSTFTVILPVKAGVRQEVQNDLRLHAVQQRLVPTLLPSSNELTPAVLTELFAVSGKREAMSAVQNVVLVVDDSLDALSLIKSALDNSPYKVVEVQDPLKVVEMVHELRPCAITLDVMMPNLNGWQILYQLKSDPVTASIPVIVLSVLSEQTTGYVLGADEYLIKPFKEDVLLDTLNRLVKMRPTSRSGV